MHDQHTRGTATTRHRSLVGRGGRKAFVRDKDRDLNSKKRFEEIELPAKLLD